jgi:hypothetical protein
MWVIMSRAGSREQQISCDRFFSIGHSHHTMADLVALLRRAGITAVADVRSRPYSSRLPHFSRPELEAALVEYDFAYAFFGDSLGGRPGKKSLYDADGRVDYERVRQTAAFQCGLDRLIQGGETHRVAMLCAEEDPLDCHRGLMIAPALVERGIAPQHVRGDGTVESTAALERRLLAETAVGAGILDGMFAATIPDEERRRYLDEAYWIMGRRKAYRLRADEMEVKGE